MVVYFDIWVAGNDRLLFMSTVKELLQLPLQDTLNYSQIEERFFQVKLSYQRAAMSDINTNPVMKIVAFDLFLCTASRIA